MRASQCATASVATTREAPRRAKRTKALEAALEETNQDQEQEAVDKGGPAGPFEVNLSTKQRENKSLATSNNKVVRRPTRPRPHHVGTLASGPSARGVVTAMDERTQD